MKNQLENPTGRLFTDRELLEKVLHMRCVGYMSKVKSLLLSETIFKPDPKIKPAQQGHGLLSNSMAESHCVPLPLNKEELGWKSPTLGQFKDDIQDVMRQSFLELESVNNVGLDVYQESFSVEQALRDSESKFRSLLQAAPDAIVIADESGVIHLVNQQTEKIFGYSQDELVGQPVETLIPVNLRKYHQDCRQRYLQNPYCRLMGTDMDLWAQTKSGKTIPVEVALSPLQTQHGLLITTSIRDISKRKQVEEELNKYRNQLEELVAERTAALSAANRELEEFSYTISHDLRAPLRSIDGFSLALMEDFEVCLPESAMGFLRRIRCAAQRMGTLIDEVLELARVSRCELNRKPVDLSSLAQDIIVELQIRNPVRNAKIHLGENLYVNADENLLRVVLENLLDNAWKFTSGKDYTEITLDKIQICNEQVFYIKDNGVGLDMQYANKLFGPFQRLHSDKDFPGTGVGLATVHRIIQRHGGRIWVESELENGTTVYFVLD